MEDLSELLFSLYFVLLGGMVLVGFHLTGKLFAYLNENHTAEYEALGKPRLIMNNTPKNNIAVLKFIFSERPLQLGDIHLIRMCRSLKNFYFLYGALLVGFFSLIGLGIKNS